MPILTSLCEVVSVAVWIDQLFSQELLDFIRDHLGEPPELLLSKLEREVDLPRK